MRCPACRAENDEGPQCRRCRADLSLLFALEEQRRAALTLAYRCLTEGQCSRALAIAEGVDTLRRDEESLLPKLDPAAWVTGLVLSCPKLDPEVRVSGLGSESREPVEIPWSR